MKKRYVFIMIIMCILIHVYVDSSLSKIALLSLFTVFFFRENYKLSNLTIKFGGFWTVITACVSALSLENNFGFLSSFKEIVLNHTTLTTGVSLTAFFGCLYVLMGPFYDLFFGETKSTTTELLVSIQEIKKLIALSKLNESKIENLEKTIEILNQKINQNTEDHLLLQNAYIDEQERNEITLNKLISQIKKLKEKIAILENSIFYDDDDKDLKEDNSIKWAHLDPINSMQQFHYTDNETEKEESPPKRLSPYDDDDEKDDYRELLKKVLRSVVYPTLFLVIIKVIVAFVSLWL